MSNKQKSPVEWYWDKIKSHFKHDGDLFETSIYTYQIAKEIEKEKMIDLVMQFEIMYIGVETHGEMSNLYEAVKNFYNETYGDTKQSIIDYSEENEQSIIDYNKMEEESEMDNYREMENE
jgi:hypothetical protein